MTHKSGKSLFHTTNNNNKSSSSSSSSSSSISNNGGNKRGFLPRNAILAALVILLCFAMPVNLPDSISLSVDQLLLSSSTTAAITTTKSDGTSHAGPPPLPPPPTVTTTWDTARLIARHKASVVYIGNPITNTGWAFDTICVQNKNNKTQQQQEQQQSILVYGVGAGENIDWDTGMIDRYGATVHLFDPTEKSIRYTTPIVEAYARKCSRSTRRTSKDSGPSPSPCLFHTPEGLSDQPGTLVFALPANPDHVSMRLAELKTADMTRTTTVRVNTLRHWMEERGHDYLDILKIDIEGSEYAVLESLLDDDFLPFTQLLVEYHSRFWEGAGAAVNDNNMDNKDGVKRHERVVRRLTEEKGFVQVWSQHGGLEAAYVKLADMAGYCEDGVSPRTPHFRPVVTTTSSSSSS
ncbi:hypothetical protein ACA910_007952 [Epithemia clementina (nom. ined.)]